MKVLHITPSTNGYEEVTLIANRISRTNSLSLIEKDGKEYMTGGYIIEDNHINRTWLDKVAKDKQFKWIKSLRTEPFIKFYADE